DPVAAALRLPASTDSEASAAERSDRILHPLGPGACGGPAPGGRARGHRAVAPERADQLMDVLGLGPYADRPTGELSTGTRRIVELACLLAQDPAVVLFDEPSAGGAPARSPRPGPP